MHDLQAFPAGINLADGFLDMLERVGVQPRVQFDALDAVGRDFDVKLRKPFIGAVDQPIFVLAQEAVPLHKREPVHAKRPCEFFERQVLDLVVQNSRHFVYSLEKSFSLELDSDAEVEYLTLKKLAGPF